MKVAIIIPYFGTFPKWMTFFLKSCEGNPQYDFYIFTDCDFSSYSSAKNVIFIATSFADYCKLVSESLLIDFSPKAAYKLCDLKPFYGYIHRDILVGYDFWGFGDIDLILGRLDNFFDAKDFSKYDYISTHGDRVSGHFFLLRNSEHNRNLCFEIPHWGSKLVDPRFCGLDERDFSNVLCFSMAYLRVTQRLVASLLGVKWSMKIHKFFFVPIGSFLFNYRKRKMLFVEMDTTPSLIKGIEVDYLYNNNGAIVNVKSGNELPYLHFLFFKKNLYSINFLWDDNTTFDLAILETFPNSSYRICKEGILKVR